MFSLNQGFAHDGQNTVTAAPGSGCVNVVANEETLPFLKLRDDNVNLIGVDEYANLNPASHSAASYQTAAQFYNEWANSDELSSVNDLHANSAPNGGSPADVVFSEIGYTDCPNPTNNPGDDGRKAGANGQLTCPDGKTNQPESAPNMTMSASPITTGDRVAQQQAYKAAYCYWTANENAASAPWFHGFWWYALDLTSLDTNEQSDHDVRSGLPEGSSNSADAVIHRFGVGGGSCAGVGP